jgi:hypothetical protein
VAGAYACRKRRAIARSDSPGASDRSISPIQVSGAVNRTVFRSGVAKQRSPRNEAALRSEPQLDRTQSASRAEPVDRPTSSASSSRVRIRSRSAGPTARQIRSVSGLPWLPNFRSVPSAPSHVPSSAAGSRCSVPRAAHILTSVRSRHSASASAVRAGSAVRATTLNSAEPIT